MQKERIRATIMRITIAKYAVACTGEEEEEVKVNKRFWTLHDFMTYRVFLPTLTVFLETP